MSTNILYTDEFLNIFAQDNEVYVESFKKGFPLDRIAAIFTQHPEISLTSLSTLRNSIMSAPADPKKIGELKERIDLYISPDGLLASVTLNLSSDELAPAFREKLKHEISAILDANSVVFGIDLSFLKSELKPGQNCVAARGAPPLNGEDAVIRMYELAEARPEVGEDGKVDFYDMRLINRVNSGDWLGERIEATDGYPGRTVTGEEIKPVKGRTAALNYDKNSVSEVPGFGKTVLYSRLNGAVSYKDGRISVSNHLEVDGDVGVNTGNIKFDGYLSIKGTILDGFSVEATKDIEINGQYGIGNIKSLVSTDGSIYIKGGVSSRQIVEIRAAKNIYVKFADNARIICGETAHIGYYSLNSSISARDVVFDSTNGQVIGGYIKAEIHVSVPICGSDMERKTEIEVTGFNRQAMAERLSEVFREIGIKKAEQQKLKLQGSQSVTVTLSANVSDRIYLLKDEIKSLEEERKRVAGYLKTKGDGEIAITRRLYPNCTIILGGIYADVPSDVIISTFYLKDGEIRRL